MHNTLHRKDLYLDLDINDLDKIEDRRVFDRVLEQHTLAEIARYEDLKKEIQELKTTVESLIVIWNQARGVLNFVKWLVGISSGVGAFLVFIKDHLK